MRIIFYKKKQNNQWYIYDVELVGVSIIQTYRKQFSEFLKTKTVKELIDHSYELVYEKLTKKQKALLDQH